MDLNRQEAFWIMPQAGNFASGTCAPLRRCGDNKINSRLSNPC
jgi:hypothetical protein